MVKNRFYRFIRATWRPFATFLHPLRVEGLENLPKDQPVLLCANHSSAVDPILLICAMRQDFPLRIMAKKQLMKIPVVGAFLRAIGVFGETPTSPPSRPPSRVCGTAGICWYSRRGHGSKSPAAWMSKAA